MKEPITQKHPMGCAVACTAYISDLTYEQALEIFDLPQNAWGEGFYCEDIVRALSKVGKSYQYTYLDTLSHKILNQPDVIVFTEKSASYPQGHYLARTADGAWMNPWINFPIIAPAKSGFQKDLPGRPTYAVYPV